MSLRRRAPLRRFTPMKRVGRKMLKDWAELEAVYPALLARSGGRCEIAECRNTAWHPHHIQPRGDGGSNDLDNLIHVCREHHHWIHNVDPQGARALGLLK